MRTKLQLIDKFRRSSWLKGGDRYYFVMRVVDGRGKDSKIFERKVTRQCYYRFDVGEFAFSSNPGAAEQLGLIEEEAM